MLSRWFKPLSQLVRRALRTEANSKKTKSLFRLPSLAPSHGVVDWWPALILAGALGTSGFISEAEASDFRVRATEPLHYTIALDTTTMISVANDRIANAVYDNRALEVKTQSDAGRLFVVPSGVEPTTLFITTERGDAIELVLQALPHAKAKTIVLERQDSAPATQARPAEDPRAGLRPLYNGDYIGSLKAMLMAVTARDPERVAVLEREAMSPDVESFLARLKAQSPVKPTAVTIWGTEHYTATVVRLAHGGLKPVVLNLKHLTQGLIAAAAVDRQLLRPGDIATLTIVEHR